MRIECRCGVTFETTQEPCERYGENCAVAHSSRASFICRECGHDSGPDVASAVSEGRVTTKPGIGFANLDGVKKIELFTDG